MWGQYRKTFVYTQLFIFIITLLAFLWTRHLGSVIVQFFIPMQFCAVFGASWAFRLKRNLEQRR